MSRPSDASLASWPIVGRDASGVVWRPDEHYVGRSRLRRFLAAHGVPDLEELARRAAGDPAWFWGAAERDLGITWDEPYSSVLDESRGIEWATWWTGGRLNYVRSAVDVPADARPDAPALTWEGEDGSVRRFTRSDLRGAVDAAAHGLADLGVGRGDRVGIFLPMIPETAIAVLALGKLGAIYSPIFSGFAAPAAAVRLNDAGARFLITADGFLRRGAVVPLKETADAAVADAPTVERVIVVDRLGRADLPWREERDVRWSDMVAPHVGVRFAAVSMSAEDPFMIIYTSGTTGRPKGAIHVHGGFPIKTAQDLAHAFDLQEDDVLFWFTDMGWMMGPWAVCGALTLRAELVFYEGAPDFPDPSRIWGLVERHRITHLGISPTLVRALMVHGKEPVTRHDRSSLVVLGSTGEPWNPEAWLWEFETVGEGRLPLLNYSGGTEISGGIVACTTLAPLKPCSFNGPNPGLAADVVDEAGAPVRGVVGELAIRAPWPGMTRGFWGDRERYLDAYWRRIEGTWIHGDWARIDEDGFWYILGRSDDTIKIAGKRTGPAEVESAVGRHPDVQESAAVGIPDALKGEALAVFVVRRPGVAVRPEFAAEVAGFIVGEMGKTLRPAVVRVVPALPRTRNGKILRRVTRAAYLGTDPGDLSALENPDAVEAVAALGRTDRAE